MLSSLLLLQTKRLRQALGINVHAECVQTCSNTFPLQGQFDEFHGRQFGKPKKRKNNFDYVANLVLIGLSLGLISVCYLCFINDYIPHPWLREVSNSAKELWESFSIGDLVRTVSGESVAKWSSRMRQAHVWGDTALLHGLACAFRVDVAVLMAGTMALVGQSLMQDAVDDCEPLTFIK